MSRPLSIDLRERVVEAVTGGESCREVAARFGAAVSSFVKWSQRDRATGSVAPGKMGGHRRPVLEPHRTFIKERIRQAPHLTLHKPKDELAARGVKVSHNAVWMFLRGEGLRFKKHYSPLSAPLRRCTTASPLAVLAGRPGSPASRLYRRDLDQDQHGSATRLGTKGRAGARFCSARELADADLSRRFAL